MTSENDPSNTPPTPPPPDPRVDQLARELETSWIQYQSAKQASATLSQRPNIPQEVIDTLNMSATKTFEENVGQSVHRFMKSYGNPQGSSSAGESKTEEKPTSEVKKLYRVEYDKMLAGVCGGIAEYFHIDSSIVRVIFVISTLIYLLGAIAYIILAIILPIKQTPDEAG